ncbi:cupin domain-containing protein [uncultured Paraglaciecola sp.]|jgi:mannose-6-phosphate isomerase|uniref:cupin domain-containing protein n=1 Tax=uncultured Paraglaciecola sp. TaxID=1765024 RepID=UPI0025E12A3C|nr:cupin domain-containing protein [uncultured Paraglaciecola sp.]
MSLTLIEKPWGKEELLEHNARYMFKRLTMLKGHACSLQYHEIKTESVYVLSGILKLYIGDSKEELSEQLMHPGDFITLNPFKVHRMEALEDTVYLEASTPELEDVVRLEDRYKRS